MARESGITAAEFRTALTPLAIRQMQILQVAMVLAPLIFLVGTLALSLLQKETRHVSAEIVPTMTIVNVVLVALSYAGAYLLPAIHYKPARIQSFILGGDAVSRPDRCLILIRNAFILRFAMLEGAALFGVAVCLIAATTGTSDTVPEYWLNAFPLLMLILYSAVTFPTEDRILVVFEQYILPGVGH